MLMKLTPRVKVINILRMNFVPMLWRQKNYKAKCNKRKAAEFALEQKMSAQSVDEVDY